MTRGERPASANRLKNGPETVAEMAACRRKISSEPITAARAARPSADPPRPDEILSSFKTPAKVKANRGSGLLLNSRSGFSRGLARRSSCEGGRRGEAEARRLDRNLPMTIGGKFRTPAGGTTSARGIIEREQLSEKHSSPSAPPRETSATDFKLASPALDLRTSNFAIPKGGNRARHGAPANFPRTLRSGRP